jgi:hypothetical protein
VERERRTEKTDLVAFTLVATVFALATLGITDGKDIVGNGQSDGFGGEEGERS